MSIGLLITSYEEGRKPGKLERAMASALHPCVTELLIYDDGSADVEDTAARVHAWCDQHSRVESKELAVYFVRGEVNLGVFGAKLSAIRNAKSEWVQSLDSDNWLPSSYWDVLNSQTHIPRRMLSPSFARPSFDYREVAGKVWTRDSLPELRPMRTFGCLANTGNQFFHRPMMLRVMERYRERHNEQFQPDYFGRGIEHTTTPSLKWRNVYDSADSFFFNKCWLMATNEIYVVPGLEYEHDVHQHSSWQAAPKEKEALPAIYFAELNDYRRGQHRDYRLLEYRQLNKRHCAVLVWGRDRKNCDRKTWVDLATFEILKEE